MTKKHPGLPAVLFPQLEQYHEEILNDLDANLTNNEWRVRNSCCLALADLLKSSAPVDLAKRAPKLWTELFRVMDDCHEDTRLAATTTAKVLSKVRISDRLLLKNIYCYFHLYRFVVIYLLTIILLPYIIFTFISIERSK